MQETKDFKYIVRVANADLDGKKTLAHALTKIKGVGFSFSNAICITASVDKFKKTGELSQDELSRLNSVIKNMASLAPLWLLNRRADPEVGENRHLVGTDITVTLDKDIRGMKNIRSYKGFRHALGLPVRGQRTRSNFRRNKGKVVGVKKPGVGKKQ